MAEGSGTGGGGETGGGADDRRLVMVAIDDSPQAEYALKYYRSVVHSPKLQVVLVYISEAPPLPTRFGDKYRYMGTELWEDVIKGEQQKALEIRAKYGKKLKENQLTGEIRTIFHTKAGEAIVEEAEKSEATLIVMGTRGMGTIRRTVFGSVSDYVLHQAKCPVLVTHM